MRNPNKRFARYLGRWWEKQLGGGTYPSEWLQGRDADALAHEFRRDTQFEITQAAFLLRRPNETTARPLVDALVPEPTEADATVLVEAIVRAGATAQKVRATTVLGAVLTVVALVVRNVLRGR